MTTKYRQRLFVCIFLMIISVFYISNYHFADQYLFINNNLQYDVPINTDLDLTEQGLNDMEVVMKELQQCWYHLFISVFVANELNHIFVNKSTAKQHIYIECNPIDSLMHSTTKILSFILTNIDSFHSFHDLLLLRRIIMILSVNGNMDVQYLNEILNLLHLIEMKHNNIKRNNYTLFNIHLPRSGGTTICSLFKRIKSKYNQSINKLHLNFEYGRNCNVGDGIPFTWFYFDGSNIPKPKTCLQQYIQMNNFTFIARESPLYPIPNSNILHPQLCDKFIYMFSFRSPIERIISWLRADTKFHFVSNNTQSNISNLFTLLFKKTIKKIFHFNDRRWLLQYSNNGVTRWLGYQHNTKLINGSDIRKSINASISDINNSDLHFYNAIKLLLQIDYVLNFASYPNDVSAINAAKYGNEYDNMSMLLNSTLLIDMNNKDSMWNILMNHLNRYFNVTYFSWNQTNKKIAANNKIFKPIKMINDLNTNDWKILYQQNYWDFKLYSLAKWIQKVDAKFYNSK